MQLDTAKQDLFLSLLFYDNEAGKILANILPAKEFDKYYSELAEQAIRYIKKYKEVPGEHTIDLIQDVVSKNKADKQIYRQLRDSIRATHKAKVNTKYALDTATKFMRQQSFKKGLERAYEVAKGRDDEEAIDEAAEIIRKAAKTRDNLFDAGIFLHDVKSVVKTLANMPLAFPTGIKEFDEVGIGPVRGELLMLMAMAKAGKTWGCIFIMLACMMAGFRCVYLSCEVSRTVILRRFIQMMFAMTRTQAIVIANRFQVDELGRFTGMKQKKVKGLHSFADDDALGYVARKLSQLMNKRLLNIRDFPSGSLTPEMIEAYFDGLESIHGYIPDMFVVDSPDIMKYKGNDKRIGIGNNVVAIRGIAGERNMAAVTPFQGNRPGGKVKTMDSGNTAEDFSVVRTTDNFLIFNQTKTEKKLGLGRLSLNESRNNRQIQVILSQALDMGQFCLDSCKMTDEYWTAMDPQRGEDEQED